MKQKSRFIQHVVSTWRHHMSLQLATAIVLIAGFTVVASVFTVSENLYRVLTLWGDSMQMSVYFNENASDENISTVKKYIEDTDRFDSPKYVSKEDALKIFKDQIASYAPDLLNDAEILKFIPTSLQLGIKKSISVGDHVNILQEAVHSLKVFPGVEDVSYGQEWVKNYATVMQALNWGGTGFVLIILVSAGFVMANSIGNSIAQRRSEVEVLELVGATSNYIRGPFVFEGALLGAATSSMALVAAFCIYLLVRNFLSAQIAMLQISDHLQFVSYTAIFGIIAFGTLIGAISAWFCVGRINTGWAASGAEGKA